MSVLFYTKNSILNCTLVSFIGTDGCKKNWSLIIITVPFRANLNNYDRIGAFLFWTHLFGYRIENKSCENSERARERPEGERMETKQTQLEQTYI